MPMGRLWPILLAHLALALGTARTQELVVAPRAGATIAIDGALDEWEGLDPALVLERAEQVVGADQRASWAGAADLSGRIWLRYDPNHLYLAGILRDDDLWQPRGNAWTEGDAVELFLDVSGEERESTSLPEDSFRILLVPWSDSRPWALLDAATATQGQPRQTGSSLTGFRVAGTSRPGEQRFEAAIPFHHLPGLRPGATRIGFQVCLHDQDRSRPGRLLRLTSNGMDPTVGAGALLRLRFLGEGPLADPPSSGPLLGRQILADLPFVLVPLVAVALLLVLLRFWSTVRIRLPWVRPVVHSLGVVLFVAGLLLPRVWLDVRDGRQRRDVEERMGLLQDVIGMGEVGTLSSYKGASRDRALMDLLAGKRLQRQKYTSYRFLADLAEGEFGPAARSYPDEFFKVRPYWIPLPKNRPELFHFDPPLRGEALYIAVARPFVPAPFVVREPEVPLVRASLPSGRAGETPRGELLQFDGPFASGEALGRDIYEVAFRRLDLRGEVRTLGLTAEQGADLRLVGVSLLPRADEAAVPLFLGNASLGGVLTDLRGAWPQDAGIELGQGATARVNVPAGRGEPFQRLWLFYRAFYPGLPVANPGEKVAEVLLQFRGGLPPRTITLEHQVSMFYQLVVHNTRDEPPEGSPAAVAFSWVDEAQERNINVVYPVLDLPAGAELESIEFRNLASYRMRFRSVVFGTEKDAAPQDPPGSPLVRVGSDVVLSDAVQARLRDAAVVVYRDRRLSEATLPADARQDYATLPRAWQEERSVGRPGFFAEELPNGARRAVAYQALVGDGWDGAVLGVFVDDPDWARSRESGSSTGLLLCLLGAPILLILFSELLSVLHNLRLRLMAVLSVASLVPLAVLSFVLAQVLERGHETDQQDAARQQVQSAVRQLEDQKERLRSSARQWLNDLAQLYLGRMAAVPNEALPEHLQREVVPELQKQMASQLPPEWRGGFLKLEFNPDPGSGEPAVLLPQVAVAGDQRMAQAETPARLEPGIYIHWGRVLIGVRSEEQVRGGALSLTVGRPVGPDLLGALAPGRSVVLADARGYPLEVAGTGRVEPQALLLHGRRPAVMAAREQATFTAMDKRQVVVLRENDGEAEWLSGCEVLRDLQNTPRALLVVTQPYQRATLDLAIGRIPVRAFFLLVAGLLVVLSAFLSFVVSGRISRPIEHLEQSAQAISRGQLDTRVAEDEGGQIGRLTRTFNQMARDLQGRVQDLQLLNRVSRDLSAQLDFDHTLAALRRVCEQHSPADRVAVALLDPEAGTVELHGGGEVQRAEAGPATACLSAAGGPFCLWAPGTGVHPLLAGLPGIRSALGLPLRYAGRSRGAALLLFERAQPLPVNLELLTTLCGQAAAALENALLYRHAVQDPVTAAFMPDYFRRRVAEEVALAQQRGQVLALMGCWLGDGLRRPRGVERFAAVVRERMPANAVLCHAGMGQFQVLLPGTDRPAAEALLGRVLEAWHEAEQALHPERREQRRPVGALVVFPEEAASAEFLFEALRDRLAAGPPVEAVGLELDESLQKAGVTAVSPPMREVYRTLRRVAPTDLTILLEGETGTGKEVLTNLIHRWSKRAAGPLVKVHCAALSENLLASELFGHEKGSFTGADRRRVGKFEQAHGGTILLDEVGEIPLDVQVKLLRVLQEREIDRVGGAGPVPVDVRVIAATNRDLLEMVRRGRFREDLYYRLQGVVVRVPPLRDRKHELPALVEHFRREVVGAGQSRVRGFSTDAMDELFRREWPGNVRELRNVVFRAMVLAAGDQVELGDVRAAMPAAEPGAAAAPAQPVPAPPLALPAPPPASPAAAVPAPAEASAPADPAVAKREADELPPRLQALVALLRERVEISTQDHMEANGVSHRTGLRDLQALVEAGVVERVGKRRGARYRLAGSS